MLVLFKTLVFYKKYCFKFKIYWKYKNLCKNYAKIIYVIIWLYLKLWNYKLYLIDLDEMLAYEL